VNLLVGVLPFLQLLWLGILLLPLLRLFWLGTVLLCLRTACERGVSPPNTETRRLLQIRPHPTNPTQLPKAGSC
jgi:hypothetical protein